MRLLPLLVKEMCAMMRCTSSGCMGPLTRSLFCAGLGVCHMALDILCQEKQEAFVDVVAARRVLC